MADTNNMMNNRREHGSSNSSNQTMQHEQAKASVSGDRQNQQGGNTDRGERSAIGGGETRSQTGEPGRARSELDDDQH